MRYMDSAGNVYDLQPVGLIPSNVPQGTLGPVLVQEGGPDATNALTVNQSASDLVELASLHATYLVGNNLIASGTGDDKDKQDPIYAVRRPWLDMPEGGLPFDEANTTSLPALPGNVTITSHMVPDGYDGVINAYSWNFQGGGFTEGSGDLVVQLLRNGVPIRNYNNITVEKGSTEQARLISPLRIYSKDFIELVISHVSNPLLMGDVVGSLVGYDYPAMS
jgi:hypothetical protein